MNKIIKKHIIVLILSIVIMVGTIGIFWKYFLIVNGKQNKVLEFKEQLAVYKQNKQIFQQEATQLKDLTDRTVSLEKNLVTTSSLPTLLSSIEDLANQNKISFNITSAQNSGKIGAEKLIISFSAKGSLQSIDNFLDQISRQSYQINFTNFYLSSESSSGNIVNSDGLPVNTKKIIKKKTNSSLWELNADIEVLSFVI